MHALKDFFSTDYGLLSFVVIVITLGMGVFFSRFFARHIREDCERVDRERALAATPSQSQAQPQARR